MELAPPLRFSAFLLAVSLAPAALAADDSKAAKKKMEMDEPMSTKMMKPGMRMGDVKKDADRRTRDMKPKLDREEKSIARGKQKQ